MNCAQCGTTIAREGRFCPQCGAPVRAQEVAGPAPIAVAVVSAPVTREPSPGAMRVCPGCGVIAPKDRSACLLCNTSLASTHEIGAPADDSYWVCVLETDFLCRRCHLRSPLDGIDTDGEVECRRCGLVQGFNAKQWGCALSFAKDVGDGSGPPGRRPALANSDYEEVGLSCTFAESEVTTLDWNAFDGDDDTLRIKVAPGAPLCKTCKVPLQISLGDAGTAATHTRCPRCGEQGQFRVDADVVAKTGLFGVIADDHRVDRPPVNFTASPGGGAVAITCPQCNAALPITDPDTTLVVCHYCKAPARIPTKALWRLGGQAVATRPWWVLFRGKSALRRAAEKAEKVEAAKAARAKARAERREKNEANRNANGNKQAHRQRERITPEEAARRQRRSMMIFAAASFGGLIMASAIVWVSQSKHTAKAATTTEPTATTTATATPTAAELRRDAFHDLDGCTCKTGTDNVAVAVGVDRELTRYTNVGAVTTFELRWLLDAGAKGFAKLAPSGDLVPPRQVTGRAVGLGLACSGDTLVVVSKDHATAWSIETKKDLWSAYLPAAYKAAAGHAESGLDVTCSAVPTSKGVLNVPLATGRTYKLKLTDGKPTR